MISSTVENYLKTLYAQQQASGSSGALPVGRLATAMGVVPGTATSMVKALADSGLVEYESRAGVRLSAKGQQLALHVLRRHRLVELFLVQVLGLDWSEVHEEADALEHAISERVLERMDQLLGHPTTDPHGDPIPTAKGQIHHPDHASLADCAVGVPHQVTRILNQDPVFLRFVERHHLRPGATLTVTQREPASEAIMLSVTAGPVVSLGSSAAGQILVVPHEPARPTD